MPRILFKDALRNLLMFRSDVTSKRAAEALGCSVAHANAMFRALHAAGEVFVSKWEDVSDRGRVPAYSRAPGVDVPKPSAKTPSERAKKYASTDKGKIARRRSNDSYKRNPKNKLKVLKYQREYYKRTAELRCAKQRAYDARKRLVRKGIAAADPLLYILCKPSSIKYSV